MIAFRADERLRTDHEVSPFRMDGTMQIRAKAWSDRPFVTGFAEVASRRVPLECVPQSALWQAELNLEDLLDGTYPLVVELVDEEGKSGRDEIRIAVKSRSIVKAELRPGRDRDNVVGTWPERGILGTQLGPNKNGRKW
jgi:Icc protein